MRILHITERIGATVIGGAQQSVELLARSQNALGHDVGVVSVADGPVAAAVCRPFRVWQTPLRRTSALLRRSRLNKMISLGCYLHEGWFQQCDFAVVAAINEFQPQIINTHILRGLSEAVWTVAADRKIPVVHTLRDYYLLCARSSMFKSSTSSQCARPCPECRLITARRRRLSRKVSGLVGISNRVIEIHRANGILNAIGRTAVIPNSVTVADGLAANVRSSSRRSNFVVGYMGRIVATKGIEELISAFAHANLPRGLLRIAGEGAPEFVNRLTSGAKDANVEFVGKVDPPEFLASCDVLVVPSLWEEPFGRVVVEALLMTVPVICSDRGSFPELLERFPGGTLTHPEDQRRFVGDLVKMRDEAPRLRNWLIENAGKIRSYFSGDSIGRQYCRFYDQVLES